MANVTPYSDTGRDYAVGLKAQGACELCTVQRLRVYSAARVTRGGSATRVKRDCSQCCYFSLATNEKLTEYKTYEFYTLGSRVAAECGTQSW